jgi:hypothetical protein
MARQHKPNAQAAPTPEQVKALTDQMDWVGQNHLLQLFMEDEQSIIGKTILAKITVVQKKAEHLERLAGIAPEQIDPQKLLTTEETDKEAKKRTRRKSTHAVKTARYKAKERLKRTVLPPFSAPTR